MENRNSPASTNSLCLELLFLLVSPFVLCCSHQITAGLRSAQGSSYYSLEAGRSWKYQLSIKESSKMLNLQNVVTHEGVLTMTTLAPRKLQGKEATPVKVEMQSKGRSHSFFNYEVEDANGIYPFAMQDSGDVEPKLAGSVNYEIKNPLKVGNTWDLTMELMNGHSVPAKAEIVAMDDVVDVPAGTFQKCLKIRSIGNGGEHYAWYAPSMGLVKSVNKDDQVTMSLELESFKK